ncbi:unnamed protein product [Rotaria magnacalcarata]|uniref:Uncharacterized protein n=1 Tax=Rotaria magnacalcarata TaxID=392030 RepID=A0A817ANQ5_9BILA|nr:unnamed protein product [Rotaria magnacalcarata]CAF2268571.1 unnamed protein product [Rotaria magnacalcarata]CAF4207192.1 unnamed protein product [Rotaria magnacalcarata]CAF4218676.1 unnamed protein product [Rotaria magnacalcarata]
MVIKQFIAELTKTLLSSVPPSSQTFNKHLTSMPDLPPLPQPNNTDLNFNGYNRQMGDTHGIMLKLDLILTSMNNINNVIADLTKRTEQIEQ